MKVAGIFFLASSRTAMKTQFGGGGILCFFLFVNGAL